MNIFPYVGLLLIRPLKSSSDFPIVGGGGGSSVIALFLGACWVLNVSHIMITTMSWQTLPQVFLSSLAEILQRGVFGHPLANLS